jgi:ZIP family zinc transporter
MEAIISYFENLDPIVGALYATLFTWGLTALGASLVFFVKALNRALLDGMLGFTGGVMVAASFWSLLAPGIEMRKDLSKLFPRQLVLDWVHYLFLL